MQQRQFDDLMAAMDPRSLTEGKKEAKAKLLEDAQAAQEIKRLLSLDEAQAAKALEAHKTPVNARVSHIAEACSGIRDPDLVSE